MGIGGDYNLNLTINPLLMVRVLMTRWIGAGIIGNDGGLMNIKLVLMFCYLQLMVVNVDKRNSLYSKVLLKNEGFIGGLMMFMGSIQ